MLRNHKQIIALYDREQEIRDKLFKYWSDNPVSSQKFAKEVGVNNFSLRTFLSADRSLNPVNLTKVRNFLASKGLL